MRTNKSAIALYRALLTGCSSAALPDDDRTSLSNAIRNKFRQNRKLQSPYQLGLSFKLGYEVCADFSTQRRPCLPLPDRRQARCRDRKQHYQHKHSLTPHRYSTARSDKLSAYTPSHTISAAPPIRQAPSRRAPTRPRRPERPPIRASPRGAQSPRIGLSKRHPIPAPH